MKKKLLACLLAVAMIFETGSTFAHAQELGIDQGTVQEIGKDGDLTLEMEESEDTPELTQPEDSDENAEPKHPDDSNETTVRPVEEPNPAVTPNQSSFNDITEGALLPPIEEVNPEGVGEYFSDEDYETNIWNYKLGEYSAENFGYEEPDYFAFQLTQQKKVQFDFDFTIPDYYMDDDYNGYPIIKLHKVSKYYSDDDDTNNYKCLSCIIQQNGSFNNEGYYSFSSIKTLSPSWYIIEVVPSNEDIAFDYNFKTKDISTYATSLSIPSTCYLKPKEKKTLPVTNILPQGAVTGITWSTDKPSVAKVDTNGKITGVSYGQCTIKATLKNNRTYTCKIYVETPILNVTKLGIG